MPNPHPVPTYLGMVICDNVLKDPETNKHYLLGTCTATFARSFPARYQKLCVYTVLTGIHERTEVRVRLVHLDNARQRDVEMMAIQGHVEAPDPLAVAELTLGLRNLIFPAEGDYRFQLLCGDELLGERKLVVRAMPAPPPTAS